MSIGIRNVALFIVPLTFVGCCSLPAFASFTHPQSRCGAVSISNFAQSREQKRASSRQPKNANEILKVYRGWRTDEKLKKHKKHILALPSSSSARNSPSRREAKLIFFPSLYSRIHEIGGKKSLNGRSELEIDFALWILFIKTATTAEKTLRLINASWKRRKRWARRRSFAPSFLPN